MTINHKKVVSFPECCISFFFLQGFNYRKYRRNRSVLSAKTQKHRAAFCHPAVAAFETKHEMFDPMFDFTWQVCMQCSHRGIEKERDLVFITTAPRALVKVPCACKSKAELRASCRLRAAVSHWQTSDLIVRAGRTNESTAAQRWRENAGGSTSINWRAVY